MSIHLFWSKYTHCVMLSNIFLLHLFLSEPNGSIFIAPPKAERTLMFTERFLPMLDTDEVGVGAEVDATPQAETTNTDLVEKDDAPQEAKIKVDYLGESKELSLDEAKTFAQKGMNYDRISEKWENAKTKLNSFESLARRQGFVNKDGHGDVDAFLEAIAESEKENEIESLASDPNRLAEEAYENRKRLAMYEQAESERKEREKVERENIDFLNFFREVKGRDWGENDSLPTDVINSISNGVPLKYAYAEHLTKENAKSKEIDEANKKNADSSTGSVTGNGATIINEFYTSEELDKLTKEDLKDSSVLAKALKSMSRLNT